MKKLLSILMIMVLIFSTSMSVFADTQEVYGSQIGYNLIGDTDADILIRCNAGLGNTKEDMNDLAEAMYTYYQSQGVNVAVLTWDRPNTGESDSIDSRELYVVSQYLDMLCYELGFGNGQKWVDVSHSIGAEISKFSMKYNGNRVKGAVFLDGTGDYTAEWYKDAMYALTPDEIPAFPPEWGIKTGEDLYNLLMSEFDMEGNKDEIIYSLDMLKSWKTDKAVYVLYKDGLGVGIPSLDEVANRLQMDHISDSTNSNSKVLYGTHHNFYEESQYYGDILEAVEWMIGEVK